MNVVLSRIYDRKKKERSEIISKKRKDDMGNMGRGGRARVYDFFRGIVSDERVSGDFPIKKIMKGNLESIYSKIK